jgi:hypothetical protein
MQLVEKAFTVQKHRILATKTKCTASKYHKNDSSSTALMSKAWKRSKIQTTYRVHRHKPNELECDHPHPATRQYPRRLLKINGRGLCSPHTLLRGEFRLPQGVREKQLLRKSWYTQSRRCLKVGREVLTHLKKESVSVVKETLYSIRGTKF